jgi:hypothetical protein
LSPQTATDARRAALHVLAATLVGFIARSSHVLASDFPLNDGGLFVVMTRDLMSADLRIPLTTTYNGLSIPFVYPPLGFYLAAAATMATRIDLIELFRWLPLVLSTAGVPAFGLLARELLQPTAARAATYAYALVPASFLLPIMGGGLTRSLGLLCALLALAALCRALDGASWRAVALAAVFWGLAVQSHPNVAAFLGLSAVLVVLVRWRTRAALARLLLVGVGAAVLAAPWWLTAVTRHGIAPFAAAATADRGGDQIVAAIGTLLRWNAWNEPLFPLVSALALVGLLISLVRRDPLVPLWITALAFVLPSSYQMLSAIPLALLAGIAVASASEVQLAGRAGPAIAIAGVGYLTLAAVLAFVGVLNGLSVDDRVAMKWIADQTPPSARVLVVTPKPPGMDGAGEWLPALSLRRSVLVPQGTEWLPGVTAERMKAHARAAACVESDGDCLERLAADGVRFDFVYLGPLSQDPAPVACCASLARALRSDARYSLAYEAGAVLIFARR